MPLLTDNTRLAHGLRQGIIKLLHIFLIWFALINDSLKDAEDHLTTSNGPLSKQNANQGMETNTGSGDIAPDADSVPGFPQDAYMEGPMMAMDKMVDKPENYGLPQGWSGFMQGMMTFVRVLPFEQYDEVMRRVRNGEKQAMPNMPGMNMRDMPNTKYSK